MFEEMFLMSLRVVMARLLFELMVENLLLRLAEVIERFSPEEILLKLLLVRLPLVDVMFKFPREVMFEEIFAMSPIEVIFKLLPDLI